MANVSQLLAAIKGRLENYTPIHDPKVKYRYLNHRQEAKNKRQFHIDVEKITVMPSTNLGRPFHLRGTIYVWYSANVNQDEFLDYMCLDSEDLLGLLPHTCGDEWLRSLGADIQIIDCSISSAGLEIPFELIW